MYDYLIVGSGLYDKLRKSSNSGAQEEGITTNNLEHLYKLA